MSQPLVQRTQERIERYQVLDRPPGRDLQALVDLAAQICEVPTAAINLITDRTQHQVATTGFDAAVCSRADSMCAAVLEHVDTVIVPDASQDDRFADNPFVTGAIGAVRFYASAPLITDDGVTIGRLCVFDDVPRALGEEQRTALSVLAERVVDVLELRLVTLRLGQSLNELTATRDELRRSNEQLTHFAAQVGHDLRTPLTAIIANTEILTAEPAVVADPDLAEIVAGTLHGARRLATLIDGILEQAAYGARPLRGEVDVRTVLGEVLRDLAPLLQQHDADVDVLDLPVVRADSHQLYAVLLNLVTNAVKFARPGVPAHIQVSGVEESGYWRVEVADNGQGVPPQHHKSVFDLHSRYSPGARDGYGIGLSTVRRIVEAHGGRIGLTALVPHGTAFWFELPR
jgi:signal transduction histidine kinase